MESKLENIIDIIKAFVKIIGASLGLGMILSGMISLFFNFTDAEIFNLIKSAAFLSFVLISHTVLKKYFKENKII